MSPLKLENCFWVIKRNMTKHEIKRIYNYMPTLMGTMGTNNFATTVLKSKSTEIQKYFNWF